MNEIAITGKCRVNWRKPYAAGTICNYVTDRGECTQTDKNRCPCGGIVRIPIFPSVEPVSEIGQCAYADVVPVAVHTFCRNLDMRGCQYQKVVDTVDGPITFCEREAALITAAEQYQKEENQLPAAMPEGGTDVMR